ncbi:MAG: thioredoxin [Planctomycetes bacterium]|nr:thioredoxin [Planctomycetota bacterium]
MSSQNVIHFTDASFRQEVLDSDKPVLVDFWAEWCGPCRMLGPIIEMLADEYAGKVKVGKVDIDTEKTYATQLGIQNIPTVIIFREGQQAKRFMGVQPKADLKKALEEVLNS